MGNNQRVAIFAVITIFMISIFGSAIFLLADQDSSDDAAAELAEQAEQLAAEQQAQQDIAQQAALCSPLVSQEADGPKEVPAFDLPSGDVTELGSVDITEGTGTEAQAGDCVVAFYHGVLTDGTVFDSAYERGTPNRFSLLQVIEGWQTGVPGMKEGGVRVLTIPSELGYGTRGNPPVIGPDADLVFVIELVEVVET